MLNLNLSPRSKSRARHLLFWVSCGALAVGVTAVWLGTTGVLGASEASAKVAEALGEAQRRGLPLLANQVDPRPAIGADQNAAPLFRAYRESEEIDHRKVRAAVSMARRRASATPEELSSTLATLQPLLTLAERVTERQGYQLTHDWDLGPEVSSPDLGLFRDCALALSARVHLSAARGELAPVWQDLARIRKLAELLSQEPLAGSLVTSLAIRTQEQQTQRWLAGRWQDDPRMLMVLVNRAESSSVSPDLSAALRSDFYLALAICRNADATLGQLSEIDSLRFSPEKLVRSGMPSDPGRQAAFAVYCDYFFEIHSIMGTAASLSPSSQAALSRVYGKLESDGRVSANLARILLGNLVQTLLATGQTSRNQEALIADLRDLRSLAETHLARSQSEPALLQMKG